MTFPKEDIIGKEEILQNQEVVQIIVFIKPVFISDLRVMISLVWVIRSAMILGSTNTNPPLQLVELSL